MRRFKLEGVDSSDWGWDENPVCGTIYTLSEIKRMYGTGSEKVEYLIDTWEEGEWSIEEHGKWTEILDE